MPKLSDEQQELRRSRILDAAEACFARAGFHRTSMQDICREAGISAGALYLYFDSKEALIRGITDRNREGVLQSFAELSGGENFLEAMAEVMEDCIFNQPLHHSRLYLDIGAESTRNPAVAETVRRCDCQILGALTELLERAEAEGRIRPLLPIPDIVAAMNVVADGLFWRRAVEPNFDAAQVGRTLLRMLASVVTPVEPGGETGTGRGKIVERA